MWDAGPSSMRGGQSCVTLQGGGRVLVWGWLGQAPANHGKEFRHDFMGSLEAPMGLRLERDMTDFKS